MERRKILLGSGAALATVLAGCSSDETGDSNANDDGTDESLSDDSSDDTGDTDDKADLPGVDEGKLKLDSDKLSIKDVNKDGDKIDVVATTTTTDPETLKAELETLANDLAAAITDPAKFKAEINSVTWVLENDGAKVMSFYVDVQWAIAYMNEEMSEDEFAENVFDTTDESQ